MKEYIAKNKVSLISHAIGLGILMIGFALGRYVFFDVHGMKEFPVALLVLGLAVMLISLLTFKKVLPYFISTGYLMGFVFGFLFQVTKMDANGVSVNNLWVIWAGVYVAFIVVGFLCEALFKKYDATATWKKSKIKRIVIAILAVLVLWLCVGITDFALVHNYHRPLFCICTEPMQDGGSGKYVGLGYSFYIEGNFMPEEKKQGVTSYRGYVFGKEVSRGFWERMEVDKLIYGDTTTINELGIAPEDIKIDSPSKLTEPPELLVACGEKQITALKGTYSWTYQNKDGTSTGIEADGMHPLECQEYMETLPIGYSTISSRDSFLASFQFEVAPDEMIIQYWSADEWNHPEAKSEELSVQAIEVDFADGRNTTDYQARLLEGNYIYQVIAKWNGREEYGGTAYYSFYTVMGDYEIVPIGK